MAEAGQNNLLASLAGRLTPSAGNHPWEFVAPSQAHDESASATTDEQLKDILNRIKEMTTSPPASSSMVPPQAPTHSPHSENTFVPQEPTSFKEADLTETGV